MNIHEQENMKRIIYVGKPRIGEDQVELRYGMTGVNNSLLPNLCSFVPDGTEVEFIIPRKDLYKRDEDATRHCPCP